MKSTPADPAQSGDLFRSRLDQIINLKHELVLLADRIDWSHLDDQVAPFYALDGRPSIPSRLMIGLHILKHIHNLSDESVCARWEESPYYQYFCGETYFQHRFPIERSSMTHWRHRIGEDFCKQLLQESLRIAYQEQALTVRHAQRVVVDTTVQSKAVTFPLDVKLRYRALIALVQLSKQYQLPLRQTYVRVAKHALMMSGRYRHAKQLKRATRQEKFIQVRLGRVIRDVQRQLNKQPDLREAFAEVLRKANIALNQTRHSQVKLYSWHAPEVECIGKGKADKPYEFGCKVSVTTTINAAPGGHFVLHAAALHDRPYDGHTLQSVIDETETISGIEPQRIYVDRGYRGHDYAKKYRVFRSGQKRGVTGVIKKELRRRSVVEPIIGHLKNHGRMGRNYLKSQLGDQQNAVLCSAGYNFRLLLKWLKKRFYLYFLCRGLAARLAEYVRLHFYTESKQPILSF